MHDTDTRHDMQPFNYQRRGVTSTVKAVNESAREIMHTISTDAIDRAGDIVEPGGAKLDNFMANPVVLVNHDYNVQSIIGKAVDVRVEKGSISARTQFRDTPLARDAFELAKAGIGGWSIGFRPIKHEGIEDEKGRLKGFRFTEWELLEYSAVAIPMNQDIVNNSVVRSMLVGGVAHVRQLFTEVPENLPPVREPEKAQAGTGLQTEALAELATALRGEERRLGRWNASQEILADLDKR